MRPAASSGYIRGNDPRPWPDTHGIDCPLEGATETVRILVLGGDGYLGWPTALHLSDSGHQVGVVDNFVRRAYDVEMGVESLVPIASLDDRVATWQAVSGQRIETFPGDLTDAAFVSRVFTEFAPEAVVHFAEQRSAPYSMIDREHAVYTQTNNIAGTLNLLYAIAEADRDIHLVKLGTMGEYGTPNITIEEGWLDVEHKGRTDRVLFPKRAGSFYHLSKVHDSHNIEFACRTWGLRATDLNQGVVYGQHTPQTSQHPDLATRFDTDAVFGTVLNRFAVQAVLGEPLTVYGSGNQTRGLIEIRDTVECIRLACEHPAERGEFRVFNQITEWLSVNQIADAIVRAHPGDVRVEQLDNPRVEADSHFYDVTHSGLTDLGLQPHLLSEALLRSMFDTVEKHRDRIRVEALTPTVSWRATASTLPTTSRNGAPNGVAPATQNGAADHDGNHGTAHLRSPTVARDGG